MIQVQLECMRIMTMMEKTYYYRGSVSGNYVKFGGYYWRVIRVNGDGTVRMIYDGTSPHDNGESSSNRQVGTQAFNSYVYDNTYVGYMYADPSNFVETNSGSASFTYNSGLSATSKYYFGTSYTLDKNGRGYKVSGDLIQGTIALIKLDIIHALVQIRCDMSKAFLYIKV